MRCWAWGPQQRANGRFGEGLSLQATDRLWPETPVGTWGQLSDEGCRILAPIGP